MKRQPMHYNPKNFRQVANNALDVLFHGLTWCNKTKQFTNGGPRYRKAHRWYLKRYSKWAMKQYIAKIVAPSKLIAKATYAITVYVHTTTKTPSFSKREPPDGGGAAEKIDLTPFIVTT